MTPIEQVREGMTVIDVDGEKVGKVEAVRLGDPEAVTSAGQDARSAADRLIGTFAAAVGRGDVPKELAERLERMGYLTIDRRGLMGGTAFAASDRVASVRGDTVQLSVRDAELVGRS